RVDLGEIESALSSHPSIAQAAVIGQESPAERLIAYFTVKTGCGLNSAALRDFAKAKLPNYMIPAIFLSIESMPLTPTGKVNRRALPEPSAEDMMDPRIPYVAPRNATERMLCEIWSAVLGVKRIGINDNFFDLGGHSLAATRVMSRVSKEMRVELPIRSLFEAPTTALMTVAVAQHQVHKLDAKELDQIRSELALLTEEEAMRFLTGTK
ncbi:MAG: phosphopantetheine-binding protein, partial [Candidatus Binatia bacterium]